jgi:hypothetical protein
MRGPESSRLEGVHEHLVESLEDEAKSGNLEGSEVYMFTDNSTVESCASRGSSLVAQVTRFGHSLAGTDD